MSYIAKFPHGGFEYTVYDRDDILATVKNNVTDPEVLEDIIKHLEKNIADYIAEGKWAGYPYLGSFKPKAGRDKNETYERKKKINEAEKVLTPNQLLAFKRDLAKETIAKRGFERHRDFLINLSAKKNTEYYTKIRRKLRWSIEAKRLAVYFVYGIKLCSQYNPDGYYED